MRRCCGFVKQMLEKPELKDEGELEIFEKCPERKKLQLIHKNDGQIYK